MSSFGFGAHSESLLQKLRQQRTYRRDRTRLGLLCRTARAVSALHNPHRRANRPTESSQFHHRNVPFLLLLFREIRLPAARSVPHPKADGSSARPRQIVKLAVHRLKCPGMRSRVGRPDRRSPVRNCFPPQSAHSCRSPCRA